MYFFLAPSVWWWRFELRAFFFLFQIYEWKWISCKNAPKFLGRWYSVLWWYSIFNSISKEDSIYVSSILNQIPTMAPKQQKKKHTHNKPNCTQPNFVKHSVQNDINEFTARHRHRCYCFPLFFFTCSTPSSHAKHRARHHYFMCNVHDVYIVRTNVRLRHRDPTALKHM